MKLASCYPQACRIKLFLRERSYHCASTPTRWVLRLTAAIQPQRRNVSRYTKYSRHRSGDGSCLLIAIISACLLTFAIEFRTLFNSRDGSYRQNLVDRCTRERAERRAYMRWMQHSAKAPCSNIHSVEAAPRLQNIISVRRVISRC